jgi:hypothetical protein
MNDISTTNTRTSKVLICGELKDISPIDLEEGMIFNIYEPDGTLVCENMIALSDAYLDKNGIIAIECDPWKYYKDE